MTLSQQLKQALASAGAFHGPPQTFTAADGDLALRCELAALETVGCELLCLSVSTPFLADATIEALKKVAAALAARLTYLMEPISPIEVDRQGCVVQLRSNPPRRGDDGATYFELLVQRGGELSLRRYRTTSAALRQTIAAPLTREVLLRLIDDFQCVTATVGR
jgi:hypothetical protein